MHPSNFVPVVDIGKCISCGICADRCPVNAIAMNEHAGGMNFPVVNYDACIGCGVCNSTCPARSWSMSRKSIPDVPPKNGRALSSRIIREKQGIDYKNLSPSKSDIRPFSGRFVTGQLPVVKRKYQVTWMKIK